MLMDDIRKTLIYFNDEADLPEGAMGALEKGFLDSIDNVTLVSGQDSIKQYLIELLKRTKVRHNGTISYKGKSYSIDYKLANRTVEVQETDDGRKLLVYLNGILIRTLDL